MVELSRNNTNCSKIYQNVCEILKEISVDYELEASELCCKYLKIDKAFLRFSQQNIEESDCIALQEAIQSRVKGIPLQYVLGEWDFYGSSFYVGDGVLIPRADTEVLIDNVLSCKYLSDIINNDNIKTLEVLDICAGTGCISITLERELSKITKNSVNVTAIEKSELAFTYLNKNINHHKSNVRAILDDAIMIDCKKLGEFDIIVSNPPYIKPSDILLLQKEVQFEPKMALDGGEDGLYFYRELTEKYTKLLKNDGELFYEIGIGQENDVKNILIDNNLKNVCFYTDLCGIIRVVSATK